MCYKETHSNQTASTQVKVNNAPLPHSDSGRGAREKRIKIQLSKQEKKDASRNDYKQEIQPPKYNF